MTTERWVQALAVGAVFAGFGLVDVLRRRFFSPLADRDDNLVDLTASVVVPFVVVPMILFACARIGAHWFPERRDTWAAWPWWGQFAVLLIADDLTQYGWHRLSHTSWLWPFHRAHHSAAYMGVRVVYRNNALYYCFMPGLWAGGVLLYLGFGWTYVVYTVVKMAVIVGAHSEARWDERLYSIRALQPLMWLVERTISTPATHFAHHALTEEDGIGYYNGNFGNLLFVWDVLFGTAKITRRYPADFGLPDDRRLGQEPWYVQVFYPLFRSKRAESVMAGLPKGQPAPEQ